MQVSFLPQSLDRISPTIGVEAALLRLTGEFGKDATISWGDEGQMEVRDALTEHQMQRFCAAYKVMEEALSAPGQLRAYVWSGKHGAIFQVPRIYWHHASKVALLKPLQAIEGLEWSDDTLTGQEVVLSEPELAAWLPRAQAELDALLPRPPQPVGRSRRNTKHQQGFKQFMRWYEALEMPMVEPRGKPFFLHYQAWCAKNRFPSYRESGFYEEMARLRAGSALSSANDNGGNR